ncbi:MAG: right-handed parallel beta-helix repeat-containing protein, partial [Verrucomicrobia bacterium]|nr:right-handed parallel beta-helix repeat-containing protein [Verrucomicrobiota bacterium]
MRLFSKSCYLTLSLLAATIATPSTNLLEAKAVQLPKLGKIAKKQEIPELLKEHGLRKQHDLRMASANTLDQKLRDAIDNVSAYVRDKVKDKALHAAIQMARETRHALKARTVTQKQVDSAVAALESIIQDQKGMSKGEREAIKLLQSRLDRCGTHQQHHSNKSSSSDSSSDDCRKVHVIHKLPYTIRKSGFYCLHKDVDLQNDTTKAAIRVYANNVDIDLANHVITLSPTIAGIFAANVTNLSVHNGTIQTVAPSTNVNSNAVLLSGVSYASFKNLSLLSTNNGASMSNCTDVLFSSCAFSGQGSKGIFVPDSTTFQGLTIESCDFDQIPNAEILIQSGGQDLSIHKCRFSNAGIITVGVAPLNSPVSNVEIADCDFSNLSFSGIVLGAPFAPTKPVVNAAIQNCRFAQVGATALLALNTQGLLVEDCLFQGASSNAFNLLGIAASDPTAAVTDTIVRDCTFNSPLAAPGFDPVFIGSAQGVLLETCVVDANGSVHIINTNGSAPSDIKVLNCVIRNSAAYGIYCDGTEGLPTAPFAIDIENCLIDGAQSGGVFFDNVQSCIIKNCEVSGTTSGPGI